MPEEDQDFSIMIEWRLKVMPWNEICAKVIEIFGLPGERYETSPAPNYLIFKFKTENDFRLCQILLSEYL